MMYLIPTENMESFEKKIARIRRKAERAKVDFSYQRLEPVQKETDLPGVTVECVPVMVECKIHYENWIVIAVLDHHEAGNVIHLVEGEWRPSAELALPSRFRTAKSFCEHCNTMRSRNKTVVIYNTQTKQFKQVGTTCLREYTGGIDAEAIAAFEEAIKSPEEFLGVSGRSKFFIETKDYLSAVVDYSVTAHRETISKYNSTLLTPLKSNCILESLRGSLMYDDDGCPNSFSSKCFFNLFNYFFDKEYGHCVPFPEIKFYLVS